MTQRVHAITTHRGKKIWLKVGNLQNTITSIENDQTFARKRSSSRSGRGTFTLKKYDTPLNSKQVKGGVRYAFD